MSLRPVTNLLPMALRDVTVIHAQPFDDPERGPRWYCRWTNRGERCWAIVDDADLHYVGEAMRSGTVIRDPDPWDPRASDEHRAMMARLEA